jgi:hypothetical protein
MPGGFDIPASPANATGQGPLGQAIDGYLRHQTWSFLFIAVCNGFAESKHYFCDLCNQWFSLANSTGNCMKHIRRKHSQYVVDAHEAASSPHPQNENTREDVLLLLLELDLPFRTVESPRFRKMTNTRFSSAAISELSKPIHQRVVSQISADLAEQTHCTLAFDEWTDGSMRRYLGITAHTYGNRGYKQFCLDHFPIAEQATSETLAAIVSDEIAQYKLEGKVQFLISDTTNVMPRTAANLRIEWVPCLAHILNLMLADVTTAVKPAIQPILAVVAPISLSTRWPKLLKHAQYATLPSYTPTRWYSLWKLVRNAVTLREHIQEFITTDPTHKLDPISVETWNAAEAFGPVLTTFKNAMLLLERDKFGSRAHGYEALEMIECAIERHAPSCWQLTEGWRAAKQPWNKCIAGPHKALLLMCVMLNPGVLTQSFLQSENFLLASSTLEKEYSTLKGQLPAPRTKRGHPNGGSQWTGITRDELLGLGSDGQNEFTEFCQMDRLPNARQKDFDPESWWESRRRDFPILYELAKKYLVIPATSASVERQFSRAKRIKSDSRTSLAPERFRSMMVLARHPEVVSRLTEKKRVRSHHEAEEADADDKRFAEPDQDED